ncbi:neither inactivation nor afterpotential protein G isoform X2 [Cephus cinctus]|uniref:Neither inactivation nor afterpotential protein G isoform X2 n=1 Tax=Cephus cinctus TaxID=211228 RepID=A0AAJ7FFF5_CEPCN|nr:neither inactivation nor afterpotential protein G isoform X2 [Cephus cinctus]
MWSHKVFFFSFLILVLGCLLYQYNDFELWTNEDSETCPETQHYDYIVVGAGSAGCIVASRLSQETNLTVLLIEAGEEFNWLSSVPLAAPLMQGTKLDWSYSTESQKFSSWGLKDNKQIWPRGKGVGGSGMLNYLVHSFGRPNDYANWPTGWNHKDLSPYFRRFESKISLSEGIPSEDELAKVFLAAGDEVSRNSGRADESRHHFRRASSTLLKGARRSSYHTYLRPVLSSLRLLTNTLVTQLILREDGNAVEGVAVRFENGTVARIEARKEIILCAGAVNTPHILMLSGIGPAEELEEHHIVLRKNITAVGKNLFDHLNVPIYVNLEKPVSLTLRKMQSVVQVLKYIVFGTGVLASNAIIGVGRVNDSGILLFGMGSADEKMLKDLANFQTKTFRALFPSYNNTGHEGFIYLASCLKTKSRGFVGLHSDDPLDAPKIDPAYLQDPDDVACTRTALDTLESSSFRKIGASVHLPDLEQCRHAMKSYRDPEYAKCVMKVGGIAGHHPGGTCRMGISDDENAVVDEHLRLKGVEGLRIVDASVLPSQISGMPNSVIVAMADRAVDLLLGYDSIKQSDLSVNEEISDECKN